MYQKFSNQQLSAFKIPLYPNIKAIIIITKLIINAPFWMSSFNTNFKIISTILAATLKFPLLLSFYFINYPHKLYFLFIPPTIPFKLFLIQQYVSQKQPVFQDTWRTLSIFRRTLHIFTYFTTCSFSILYMKIYLSI